jgi:CubicO group peptidase (beta-lactamase class C family)
MGAGGMVSTPSDLTQFIEALFGGKLISPASLEQMKTIQDKYGMGLFKYRFMIKKGTDIREESTDLDLHCPIFPKVN